MPEPLLPTKQLPEDSAEFPESADYSGPPLLPWPWSVAFPPAADLLGVHSSGASFGINLDGFLAAACIKGKNIDVITHNFTSLQ